METNGISEFRGLADAGRAYTYVLSRPIILLRSIGLWSLLAMAQVVGLEVLLGYVDLEIVVALVDGLTIFAAAAVAVAWHRFVLLGVPMPALPLEATKAARYALLFCLLSAAVALVLGAFINMTLDLPATNETRIVVLAVAALIVLALLAVVVRFSLRLPAIALGDHSLRLGASWVATARIWPGLWRGTLLTLLPSLFALPALSDMMDENSTPADTAAILLIYDVAAFTFAAIFAGFLSFAYRAAFPSNRQVESIFE
ncbi:MAG: hypothetical protein GC190_11935 [Alphaproteobacteria bacterium]|nr:hypothetical protein [Alphaproteobacteria bacterium]